MSLEIRPLTEDDYATVVAIFDRAFGRTGGRISEMAFIHALQPDGYFIAMVDGEPVGLVGMIDYGRVAYIGSLSVLPEYQGRGIGRALMDHIVAQINARGQRILLLEATTAGARIYPKMGFVVDGTTHVYRQKAATPPAPARNPASHMQSQDIAEVAELDIPVFGDNRARVLRAYWQRLSGRALVARSEQDRISGYLYAQGSRLGPWVARRPQDAESLLSEALTLACEQPPVVAIPAENIAGCKLLEQYGFIFERSMLHMRLGGERPVGERSSLFALATPGIG